jgi:glycosyltransferase involved in cell wall biosynthesis
MNAVSSSLKKGPVVQSTKVTRVLDIWAHLDPSFGGVGPAAASLASAVDSDLQWRSEMLAVCNRTESGRHADIPATVQMIRQEYPRPFADMRLVDPLNQAITKADVCHIHGMWLSHSIVGARLAKQLRRPFVFSAHGMLEAWELANKRLKKRLYSLLFQHRALEQASCLRALSEQEASDYRSYGLRNPIAIVPNGVATISRVNPAAFLDKYPHLKERRLVLFLSRVHRKKGLLELLQAWPSVARRHSDVHLLIAGAEFEGSGVAARQMVQTLGISHAVTFCGVLNGADKISALSAATLFCLPSHSEGMSVAVLEALSIGLPVVITRACNVDGVAESGAGYVTSPIPAELADAISAGMSLTRQGWLSMSESARLLAQCRYSWSQSGDAMRSVYDWLLGGPMPNCAMR